MKANEIVRTIMTEQDIGPTKLANRLGKITRLVTDRLNISNPTVEKLQELLKVLDYKIVIMPAGAKLPKDSYEVE